MEGTRGREVDVGFRDARVKRNEHDDRPVALPFRMDPRTIWAYEARGGLMRVWNQDRTEFEIPRGLFEKIYSRC
jgi:hypothetical protein